MTGFSFLWTLLLVAFLSLGVTVGVEVDSTMSQRARERELLSVGRQFKAAIASYHESKLLAGRKEFPATLDDLLLDSRGPGVNRHLRKVFVDPMTGKAEWGLVRVAGRIVGVHSLSDKRPIKQDGFDVDEAGFRHKRMVSEWVFSYTGRPQDAGKPTPPPGRPASGLASEPRT
jgi:hypothetical protein